MARNRQSRSGSQNLGPKPQGVCVSQFGRHAEPRGVGATRQTLRLLGITVLTSTPRSPNVQADTPGRLPLGSVTPTGTAFVRASGTFWLALLAARLLAGPFCFGLVLSLAPVLALELEIRGEDQD